MKFPESWKKMVKSERRELSAPPKDFPRFVVEDPQGNELFELTKDDFEISSLES
jgi:hypothetical protein